MNARIAGDAWLVSDAIRFGPDAVVLGQLRYSSEAAIDVPASVASEDRVQFSPLSKFDVMSGFHDGWSQPEFPVLPSFISVFSGFLITLLLMIVVGAIFLTFIPKQVERVRAPIAASPGRTFLVGIIGLAMLFGLVPITALTIIGLPLGLCLESGGNSPAAFSERFDLRLIRRRGQVSLVQLVARAFPSRRPCASGFGLRRGAPKAASARLQRRAARSVF